MSDTLEQDDQRWLKRYHWHIASIPELLMLARMTVVPLKAASYGERVQGGGDVRRLPMSGDGVDDADLLWALLVIYAREVAYKIGGSSPAVIRDTVWSTSEPQGLPPGISAAFAFEIGKSVTEWLIPRALSIAPFAELQDTEDHLFGIIRSMRNRYGLQTLRDESAKMCDICGSFSVVTQYENVGSVEFSRVWCSHCGYEVEEVTRVGNAHIPAGRAEGGPVCEDDQAVEKTRAPDGA